MIVKPAVSIIIVHYRAKKELFDCLHSITLSHVRIPYEVIVVDNDEEVIEKELKKKFPKVIYFKSPGNIGFGAGNNLGAKAAKGEYLFFLNPDTIMLSNTIDSTYTFIEKHTDVGIVSPFLIDENKRPFLLQGSSKLTPLVGIFALGFLAKYIPNNSFYRKYYLLDIQRNKPFEVDVVPGTSLFMGRELFTRLGGFDEKFFLYFEECDICNRVRQLGYAIYILPQAKLIHLWGRSTKDTNFSRRVFERSRFYYFRKHFGFVAACIVQLMTKKW